MNHSVKRRRQALHQTHHHYYLNISVEAANLSDWRIESNRIETFLPELECSSIGLSGAMKAGRASDRTTSTTRELILSVMDTELATY